MIAANFMTEQLAKDMERSELVNYGKMSQLEADEQSEEWEKVRYSIRSCLCLHAMIDGFTIAEI
jgi:hypothetical protein